MSIAPFTPMTKEVVAQVLGVSIRTIENLVNAGKMPAPGRIGGRVLWHPDVFYTWLDQELRAPGESDGFPAPVSSGPQLAAPAARRPPAKQSAVARMQERQAHRLSSVTEEARP
ncbi:helix-turn-helix transcriptional regulator [Cupriavidus lacunae]|uniref:Helix-turn-helix domain-containing protein n=1 Tax=Cupriavidus lacunae TaxID=2666307 RepID=A0A370NU58_9BURK|nr:helix-turn-helix domain-containing protein [Cupriavidus lacunae]RDK09136.1 hypothetical protein DN412_16985 [Cupriavidus lacunae]